MIASRLIAFLTLLLFQKGSALFLEQDCGLYNNRVNPNPWVAKIRSETNRRPVCTGTLINKRIVLTTASCLENQGPFIVCLGKCEGSLRGKLYEVHHVLERIIHKMYSKHSHQHNIGLLKLVNDVEYKPYIQPICILIDSQKIFPTLSLSNSLSGVKMHSKPTSSAGLPRGSIGKPLSIPTKFESIIRKVQHGILSYRNSTSNAFIYTHVLAYADWIISNALDVDIILNV